VDGSPGGRMVGPIFGLLPAGERRRIARGWRRARTGDPLGDLQSLEGPVLEAWMRSAAVLPATDLDTVRDDLWACEASGIPIVVLVRCEQDLHTETAQLASVLGVSDDDLRAAAAAVVPEHRIVVVRGD
jgi:hypothetical protein